MQEFSRRSVVAGLAAAGVAAPSLVRAQAWPENRTVTVVVPFPPGGGTDVVARVLADRLGIATKARFVIDNRPGAGGSIGYMVGAKAPADGSTVLLTSSAIATMPYLYPGKGYQPQRDLAPVSLIGSGPSLLCVGPSLPNVTSVAGLIEEAKARPNAITYASAGIGSGLHLSTELFKKLAGIDIKHVPYKGAALATGDLLGGRIDMIVDILPSVRPLVMDGKLRALGITTATRSKLAPDYAPIAETVPGYEFAAWFGLYMPAGSPPEMIERLQAAVAGVLGQPEVQERYAVLGVEPVGSKPAEFQAFMAADMARWEKLVKDLGITADG